VGGGPAGMTAAIAAAGIGHRVTLYERSMRLGGQLHLAGAPPGREEFAGLACDLAQQLAEMGVTVVLNAEVDRKALSADRPDALILATGGQPAVPPIEGAGLDHVVQAWDILSGARHAGERVVVIGGGDTGTDCVGTALRHGARSVTQLEILPQPPERRAPDNPWPQWPKVSSMDYGQQEAAALQGADPRVYATQTLRFAGEGGTVREVHTAGLKWSRSPEGRMQNEVVPDSERVIPADLVLLALGFLGPERKGPITELGLKLDGRGNVVADGQRMTSLPGVFAAGDMVRGQSLVVWAIHEGRNTARSVDRYLSYGKTYLL